MSKSAEIVILMLGGARRVSVAELLKESGKRLGYDVKILSYELDAKVPIAVIGEVIIGKKWSDPELMSDLENVISKYNVNIILPFVDGAIEIASKCKLAFPHLFVPVSDFALAQQMFDKTIAAEIFEKANLPIPTTYSTSDIKYPAIAKPRRGSASQGIKILTNPTDFASLTNIEDYIIQEYIEQNDEYTIDCYVADNGQTMCVVPRIRLEVVGGEVTKTQTCKIPELIEISNNVLSSLNFRGPITLQFLFDKRRQQFFLMEINPRLGGGVVCSILANAPIADYIIKESLNLPISQCNNWKDHTLMVRYRKEVIFYE